MNLDSSIYYFNMANSSVIDSHDSTSCKRKKSKNQLFSYFCPGGKIDICSFIPLY